MVLRERNPGNESDEAIMQNSCSWGYVLLETVGRLQVYNLRQGPSPIPRALSTRAINS